MDTPSPPFYFKIEFSYDKYSMDNIIVPYAWDARDWPNAHVGLWLNDDDDTLDFLPVKLSPKYSFKKLCFQA